MAWKKGETTRADGSPRETRPDSEADRIVIAANLATQHHHRGVTVAEIAASYTTHYGDALPPAFTSRVHSLVKGGVLVPVGGRVGRTRFAWRETASLYVEAEAVADPGDDVLRVLAACTAATTRFGRAVSTREVTEALQRLDLVLDSKDINAVRRALATLARPRKRGAPEWREPRVVRKTLRSTTGRGSAWWWPTQPPTGKDRLSEIHPFGKDGPTGALPAFSRSEVIRRAVGDCVHEIGRPVSRRELRWWVLASGDPAIPVAILAKDLETAVQADRRAVEGGASPTGRLHRLVGDLTAYGAAPPRVTLLPSSRNAEMAGRIEDAALGLRIADELEGITRIQRSAMLRHSGILSRLWHDREATLTAAFAQLTAESREADRARAVGQLLESYDALERSVRKTPQTSDARDTVLRELSERRRHIGAVPHVPMGIEPASWRLLGVSRESLIAYVDAAGLEIGQPVAWFRLLRGVRRTIPASPVQAAIPGLGKGPPPILLDRVDALLAIYRRVPVARANALLSAADGLLGVVLRDPSPVRLVQGEVSGSGVASTRRAAVIALGLLGALGDEAHSLAATGDTFDISAAILAVVLNDPMTAPDQITRIGASARNAESARIAEKAMLRVRRGRLISVIG